MTSDLTGQINTLYSDYENKPYISPDRNVESFLAEVSENSSKKVPKRNMEKTEEGLLPGDIILLWRISHGTFTNQYPYPKYFEYDYGIDGDAHKGQLIKGGYAREYTPTESLVILTAGHLKKMLKAKGVSGYSKLKKAELVEAVSEAYDDKELDPMFEERGYALTNKGQTALDNNQDIINRHPQKSMYK